MADPATKLKKVAPRCTFCVRDLKFVRIHGSDVSVDSSMKDFEFDVLIEKGKAEANVNSLQKDAFSKSTNPMKFLAEIEIWIEDEAETVRCPYCSKPVKLVRIPIVVSQPASTSPMNSTNNPFAQTIIQAAQQAQQAQQAGAPFQMPSPNFGSNRAAVQLMFDSKFTDQELTDILIDLDVPPQPGASRSDLLVAFLDYLYQ